MAVEVRRRRPVRWILLGVSGALLLAWTASLFGGCAYAPSAHRSFSLSAGCLSRSIVEERRDADGNLLDTGINRGWQARFIPIWKWKWASWGDRFGFVLPQSVSASYSFRGRTVWYELTRFPLWLPFLLTSIPAAFLFRREVAAWWVDRSRRTHRVAVSGPTRLRRIVPSAIVFVLVAVVVSILIHSLCSAAWGPEYLAENPRLRTVVPAVMLIASVAAAYLCARWMYSRMGWRRVRMPDHRPRCERCGYDLTGNVSGQCSECGMAIPMPAAPVRPASGDGEGGTSSD